MPIVNPRLPAHRLPVGIPGIRQPQRVPQLFKTTTPPEVVKVKEAEVIPYPAVRNNPKTFPEINPNGTTNAVITYGTLDFLNQQFRRMEGPTEFISGGPRTFLPGPPVFVSVDLMPQFKFFPPFAGAEAGYWVYSLLPPGYRGQNPRLLVSFNSIDVGIGFKGKAVVPPLGITKEFQIFDLYSPEVREIFKDNPREIEQVIRGGYGPPIDRDELLARGAEIEAAILFPTLQGKNIGYRRPVYAKVIPPAKEPRSTIINPHDC